MASFEATTTFENYFKKLKLCRAFLKLHNISSRFLELYIFLSVGPVGRPIFLLLLLSPTELSQIQNQKLRAHWF